MLWVYRCLDLPDWLLVRAEIPQHRFVGFSKGLF